MTHYCAKNSKGEYFSHDIRDKNGITYVTVPKPTFAWLGSYENIYQLCENLNRNHSEDFEVVEYIKKQESKNV